MAFQRGNVEPIVFTQDNSGIDDDTITIKTYTAEKYGAPDGARILVGSVSQSQYVSRGYAYVEDLSITEDAITFKVFTQAAGGFIIGHHSGAITVTTGFEWYLED